MENNPFIIAAKNIKLEKNLQKEKENEITENSNLLTHKITDLDFGLLSNNQDPLSSKDILEEKILKNDNSLSNKLIDHLTINNLKNREMKNFLYNPKYRSHFILNEILLYEEDEETEYKEYFPLNQKEERRHIINNELNEISNKLEKKEYTKNNYEREKSHDHFDKELIIKKTVCSFLNKNGGRIYFGISDIKKILGINIPHFEKDSAQLNLFNMISGFWPSANIKNLKVLFYPIKNSKNKYIRDLYIVKLIVKKGDPYALYSIQKDSFKSFIRSNNQCINLTAENIMKEIIDRNNKKTLKLHQNFKNNHLIYTSDLNSEDFKSNSYLIKNILIKNL